MWQLAEPWPPELGTSVTQGAGHTGCWRLRALGHTQADEARPAEGWACRGMPAAPAAGRGQRGRPQHVAKLRAQWTFRPPSNRGEASQRGEDRGPRPPPSPARWPGRDIKVHWLPSSPSQHPLWSRPTSWESRQRVASEGACTWANPALRAGHLPLASASSGHTSWPVPQVQVQGSQGVLARA